MKKQILAALAIAVFTVSCSKSTKAERVENPDGATTTITTAESSAGIEDSSKTEKIKQEVKAKVDETGRKIDNAADKTKEELHKAGENITTEAKEIGKDVKDAAAKGAQKVEEEAKELKENLKK